MPLIDDVIEYAKGNAAAAKSLDEQQTWAAHHRSLVEIRRQYEQQINDCLAAFTGRHESDAKVIAALREALKTVKLFIADQTIAHAVVVPAHVDLKEWPRSNLEFPSLMQVIDHALAVNEQTVTK